MRGLKTLGEFATEWALCCACAFNSPEEWVRMARQNEATASKKRDSTDLGNFAHNYLALDFLGDFSRDDSTEFSWI